MKTWEKWRGREGGERDERKKWPIETPTMAIGGPQRPSGLRGPPRQEIRERRDRDGGRERWWGGCQTVEIDPMGIVGLKQERPTLVHSFFFFLFNVMHNEACNRFVGFTVYRIKKIKK